MKKATIFLLTALAAIFSFSSLAQTTIMGSIFNVRGEGVEYATIALEGDTIGTLADAQGHFTLTIPKGKNNDLVITHVSYDKASIPFSSYRTGKPLSIIVKDKNVKLDEVVIGKKNKMKTILGKKLPGPTASFRGKGQQNWLEWGPTFKAKKNWVVSDIFFTIKKSTYSRCVLSFTIYEVRGKKYVNILNKPIYKTFLKQASNITSVSPSLTAMRAGCWNSILSLGAALHAVCPQARCESCQLDPPSLCRAMN